MKNVDQITMHYLRKSVIFFIHLLFTEFSSGRERDTLSTGQTLSDGEFLVSVKKTFNLGFFSAGMSSNRYLGISYNNHKENRVVWVANRDDPLNDRSGVVSFHTPNKLVMYGSDPKRPNWSTGFLGPGKIYSAQLLDTGNLIVVEEDKGVTAWQSFDHPTDTWLPDMKLGFNRKTGLNWSLTSWKSGADPGTGEYSFRMDVISEFSELSLYRGLSRIWRSGPSSGARLGEISPTYIFNVTYVDSEDGVYVTYGMRGPSNFSVIAVDFEGFMSMSEWNPDMLNWTEVWNFPKEECDHYNHCGLNKYCVSPNNELSFVCSCFPGFEPKNKREKFGEACVRKRKGTACRNREGFFKMSSMKMPDFTTARVGRTRGWKECQDECLRDCNCTAYANATEMGIACVMWYGNLLDTRQYESYDSYERDGRDLFVRVDAAELARNSSSNKKLKVAAVATSVGVLAASIAIFILCWRRHKRKGGSTSLSVYASVRKKLMNTTHAGMQQNDQLNEGLRSREEQGPANDFSYGPEVFQEREVGGPLPFVDLISVVQATNNFSEENKVGQGRFGSVYKGTLGNGKEVAVKRLSEKSGQLWEEFKNEAILIRRIQHRNLIKLLACCVEQDEKIVIYEYMPNKSLDYVIFDHKEGSCLNWAQRFNIILGIMEGLMYIHHGSRLKIVHRDIKASNILLDDRMNPKISDFGIAKFFASNEAEAVKTMIVGTYGYMAPEYAMEGICSTKSDVYSFGVLLLEIVSGRKNSSFFKEESFNLVGHVWKLWCEERALELVDPLLLGNYPTKTVLRCIHVGILCVQLNADDRPNMHKIREMLLASDTDLPPPRQPPSVYTKYESEYASSGVFTSSRQSMSSSENTSSSKQTSSSSSSGPHSVNDSTFP